ncbi:uncharacterized protein LOC116853476 [Odontomachus brunneus]|uniref:uncharacterized protein LOC116853476 n=1 Tax=Odontomachus brunneus TaxID=486640 RepID=UPI0013F20F53|nr:uncharacterized protein LOC116853476 [Odontomachus brunneus]
MERAALMDNGTEFVNRTLKEFAGECGIELVNTPPYHPQANPVERVNRVIKTMIVAYLRGDHREWDRHVNDFRFVYNSAHHTSLGASPAFLNFGRELEAPQTLRRRSEATSEVNAREPGEWTARMRRLDAVHAWVREHLDTAYQEQAYNLRQLPRRFGVGDLRELNIWDDVAEALRNTPMRVERLHQAVVRDFPATTSVDADSPELPTSPHANHGGPD